MRAWGPACRMPPTRPPGRPSSPAAAEVWGQADIVCKVKEPQPEEYPHIRADQTVFTYFHFAASRALSEAMQETARHLHRL